MIIKKNLPQMFFFHSSTYSFPHNRYFHNIEYFNILSAFYQNYWNKKESKVNTPDTGRGVTVDNDGNVYVTSYSSNSVVVLEPDGRHGRQILSSDNGLKNPILNILIY
jgi:hypothetical protein